MYVPTWRCFFSSLPTKPLCESISLISIVPNLTLARACAELGSRDPFERAPRTACRLAKETRPFRRKGDRRQRRRNAKRHVLTPASLPPPLQPPHPARVPRCPAAPQLGERRAHLQPRASREGRGNSLSRRPGAWRRQCGGRHCGVESARGQAGRSESTARQIGSVEPLASESCLRRQQRL